MTTEEWKSAAMADAAKVCKQAEEIDGLKADLLASQKAVVALADCVDPDEFNAPHVHADTIKAAREAVK